MPRPIDLTFTPQNQADNNIAQAQTTAGAANLNLNGTLGGGPYDSTSVTLPNTYNTVGATVVSPSVKIGRQIVITTTSNVSTVNYTITGFDENGKAQTSTSTLPNNTTKNDSKYWSSITTFAVDAAVASNMRVGTTGVWVSSLLPTDYYAKFANMVTIELTGTCTFNLDETFDYILAGGSASITPVWITPSSFSSKSATLNATTDTHTSALRLRTASYTNGAILHLVIYQGAGGALGDDV